MSLSLSSLTSRRLAGPPLRTEPKKPLSEPAPSDTARPKERSTNWVAIATGATLTGLALTGCTEPVPPAPDPGAYELESPEVVVLSGATQRIDLSREREEHCSGFGEDEECHYDDVAYHPIGIHFGEGIVQDLNGNLFAAPQLADDKIPGLAVSNPDSVFLDGPWRSEGNLSRLDANTVETRDSLFGRNTITLSPNEAVVTQKGLFGGQYERMRVRLDNGVVTVSENRWDQELVQSQGEHLLVQTVHGGNLGEIRHSAGSYSVTQPGLFGAYEVTATYGPNSLSLESNNWGGAGQSVTRGQDSDGRTTLETRDGRWHTGTTTVTQDGWIDHSPGLFGGSQVEYHVKGGEMLP